MILGHRRKLALELNGITETNCYIEDLNDDEAKYCYQKEHLLIK